MRTTIRSLSALLLGALAALPALALAEAATSPPVTSGWAGTALAWVAGVVGPWVVEHALGLIIGAVTLYLVPKAGAPIAFARAWVAAHLHSVVLKAFLDRAGSLVQRFVEEEAAAGADAAKAATADGRMPADVARAAYDAVFSKAKASLGPLWTAMSLLVGEVGVQTLLKATIEEAVSLRNRWAPKQPAEVAPAPAPTVEGPRSVVELPSGRKLVKPGEPVPAT